MIDVKHKNVKFDQFKNNNKIWLNIDLEIEGLLLTMYDTRLRLSNQVVEDVKTHFQNMQKNYQ